MIAHSIDASVRSPKIASIPMTLCGRPGKKYKWLLADKGYDAQALRGGCD